MGDEFDEDEEASGEDFDPATEAFGAVVESSFITGASWSPFSGLTVYFQNGPAADYPNAGYGKFLGLTNAGSPGSYYWRELRVARGRKG